MDQNRTDSTTLSQKALGEAATAVKELYGAEYHHQRQYQTKVRNAQEAHEAIRPTDFDRRPQQMSGLDPDEQRIYDLVWKRAIASQMADAVGQTVSIRLAGRSATDEAVEFTASGRTITFAGFLKAYVETVDSEAGGESDDAESRLPQLVKDQALLAAAKKSREDPRRDEAIVLLEQGQDEYLAGLRRRIAHLEEKIAQAVNALAAVPGITQEQATVLVNSGRGPPHAPVRGPAPQSTTPGARAATGGRRAGSAGRAACGCQVGRSRCR